MLILSRKKDEMICITVPAASMSSDCIISVVVTRINKYRVRLGISAPNSVSILRKELIDDVAK